MNATVWRACRHCGAPVRRYPPDSFSIFLVNGVADLNAEHSFCLGCGMPNTWQPDQDMEDQSQQLAEAQQDQEDRTK